MGTIVRGLFLIIWWVLVGVLGWFILGWVNSFKEKHTLRKLLLAIGIVGGLWIGWVFVVAPIFLNPILLYTDPSLHNLLRFLVGAGIPIILIAVWVKKCVRQVGTTTMPLQAVLLTFGRPVDVLPLGLHWRFWPFQTFRLLPLAQYKFPYRLPKIYSQETINDALPKGLSSRPIEGQATLYLQFPDAEREYLYGFPGEAPRMVPGKELILRGYNRYPPIDFLREGAGERLGRHLQDTVLGGVRQVMAGVDHQGIRLEKAFIEDGVKGYLLAEPGNPLHEMCIPGDCMDVEISILNLVAPAGQTELDLAARETAWRQGEATTTKATHDGLAAVIKAQHDAQAMQAVRAEIEATLQGLINRGVSQDVAALMVAGSVQGQQISFQEITNLAMLRWMRS